MKANKESTTRLLKTARGQLDGILKMIEDDRYCIDVSNQIMAVQGILGKVNKEILIAHVGCCVKESLSTGDTEEKTAELTQLIEKLVK